VAALMRQRCGMALAVAALMRQRCICINATALSNQRRPASSGLRVTLHFVQACVKAAWATETLRKQRKATASQKCTHLRPLLADNAHIRGRVSLAMFT
jgi:hypothetical protein